MFRLLKGNQEKIKRGMKTNGDKNKYQNADLNANITIVSKTKEQRLAE